MNYIFTVIKFYTNHQTAGLPVLAVSHLNVLSTAEYTLSHLIFQVSLIYYRF